MGCNSSGCCNSPQIVVNQSCQVFTDLTAAQTFWTNTGIPSLTVIAVSIDSDATAGADVTINQAVGTPITYTLAVGQARTDSVNGATSASITPAGSTAGKICVTLFKRFYD